MTIPSCSYQKQDCQTSPVSIDKLTTENKTTTAYFTDFMDKYYCIPCSMDLLDISKNSPISKHKTVLVHIKVVYSAVWQASARLQ